MKTGQDLVQEIDMLRLPPGAAAFWWLGQLGYIVKVGEVVLYFDPYLAHADRRLVPPLLKPEEVTNAHWVFGSHDHGDHIDPVALPKIAQASPQARFVCSRAAARHLLALGLPQERVLALDEGMTHVEGGVRITPIAAAHEFLDRDPELGYPYLSFIVEVGGVTIYHAGDTVCYEGMLTKLRRWQIDLAFLPINGRDAVRYARHCIGNMTYQEAADLAGALRPRLTVPGHYDMFANNAENPLLFADYFGLKYPGLAYWLGGHGELVMLPPKA